MTIDKVIIIDDDRFDRMLVQRAIRKAGSTAEIFEFAWADPAMEFLSGIDDLSGYIMFIDINMPRVDGFQFIDRLHAMLADRLTAMKIAIVSTSMHPRDRLRAGKDPRITYYFGKPVCVDELARSVFGKPDVGCRSDETTMPDNG